MVRTQVCTCAFRPEKMGHALASNIDELQVLSISTLRVVANEFRGEEKPFYWILRTH